MGGNEWRSVFMIPGGNVLGANERIRRGVVGIQGRRSGCIPDVSGTICPHAVGAPKVRIQAHWMAPLAVFGYHIKYLRKAPRRQLPAVPSDLLSQFPPQFRLTTRPRMSILRCPSRAPYRCILLLSMISTGSSAALAGSMKPAFTSKVITNRTEGKAVKIKANIVDAKELYLVVDDGGNGYSCDWANWIGPKLVGPKGEQKLTELKWETATAGFGQVRIGENCRGGELKTDGEPVADGIGTHANSVIGYKLPKNHEFTTFVATGGMDDGGAGRGNRCSDQASVRFLVYTDTPPASVIRGQSGGSDEDRFDPKKAAGRLKVHEDLQVELFASEPMMLSPSNIEIDHLGRVWICEIVNYRGHNGKRPEGDRILVLEDTNSDGVADKSTVFYQGRDIDSPHGICVLGTPDGTNTRAIVSAKGKVQVFVDHDGDLKADSQTTMFSGISGEQHDHGIHAFVFGPDGRLYFNFGNAGRQLCDAEGQIVVDLAGNQVRANRKPYQEGMVFRCNEDGSALETLGWNFRNNWEVTVDSYGTIWQSDNDDDGNRGVRINYVMEFGNYGFKDEFTGAGWQQKRTNWAAEIPLRHWHLNDPGVVPNLLQTGAGSPTGITIYEGDLLPAEFRGQILHCDAGPNVCRAYPVQAKGAGYTAETRNILEGIAEKWFRPSDVQIAPDGSIFVADWFDPGVGGHAMGDLTCGRVFRVTPKGHQGYRVPKYNYSSVEGAIQALHNPSYAVRYVAFKTLHAMGGKAESQLAEMFRSDNPRMQARALWLLGKIDGRQQHYVNQAITDSNSDIRITGLRLARQSNLDLGPILDKLATDSSAAVRRECALALRHYQGDAKPTLWAELATRHDGQDRWYLEALGIGADGDWDRCFAAWKNKVGDDWNTPAGRDIVWRSRADAAAPMLASLIKNKETTDDRYFRAFDFHKGPVKDKALESLLVP